MASTTLSDQTKENSNSFLLSSDPNPLIQTYDWFAFPSDCVEICYLDSFFKDKQTSALDHSILDIEDFHLESKKKCNTSVGNIIKDQYLRILKYGNISSYERNNKTPEKALTENEYDLNDPFIDDTDLDHGLIKMEVYQSGYNDYLCYEGGLAGLLLTEHYKNRMNDLENIRKFTEEDQKIYMKKKRGRKASKKNPKKEKENEKKEKATPVKKKLEIIEIVNNDEEKKQGLLYFDNLRPEERKEECKIRSQTSSVKKVEVKPKNSVQTKAKNSAKKSASKRKRDSMVKKNEIFNANHPTLGKFKMNKKDK